MGQASPEQIGLSGGVHVHVCLCAQERGQAWSDTFIIHYVYSKRNVRIWVISSSCRDLLVGGGGGWRVGGGGSRGGLLTGEQTEMEQEQQQRDKLNSGNEPRTYSFTFVFYSLI